MVEGKANMMPAAAPARAKPAAKSAGYRLEAAGLERAKNVTPGFFRRMFGRKEPSMFHRCLAIHMHHAQQASALD